MRRLLLAATIALTALPAHALDLPTFFAGRTHGEGTFTSPLFGTNRSIKVETVGRQEGRSFILTEYVTYGDGAKETAVWRFTPAGAGRYDGTRTKVTGVVPVRVGEDGAVRMGYVAEVAGPDGGPVKLRFEDTLRQTGPKSVVNTAAVSFLGIDVGTVEITFVKR